MASKRAVHRQFILGLKNQGPLLGSDLNWLSILAERSKDAALLAGRFPSPVYLSLTDVTVGHQGLDACFGEFVPIAVHAIVKGVGLKTILAAMSFIVLVAILLHGLAVVFGVCLGCGGNGQASAEEKPYSANHDDLPRVLGHPLGSPVGRVLFHANPARKTWDLLASDNPPAGPRRASIGSHQRRPHKLALRPHAQGFLAMRSASLCLKRAVGSSSHRSCSVPLELRSAQRLVEGVSIVSLAIALSAPGRYVNGRHIVPWMLLRRRFFVPKLKRGSSPHLAVQATLAKPTRCEPA